MARAKGEEGATCRCGEHYGAPFPGRCGANFAILCVDKYKHDVHGFVMTSATIAAVWARARAFRKALGDKLYMQQFTNFEQKTRHITYSLCGENTTRCKSIKIARMRASLVDMDNDAADDMAADEFALDGTLYSFSAVQMFRRLLQDKALGGATAVRDTLVNVLDECVPILSDKLFARLQSSYCNAYCTDPDDDEYMLYDYSEAGDAKHEDLQANSATELKDWIVTLFRECCRAECIKKFLRTMPTSVLLGRVQSYVEIHIDKHITDRTDSSSANRERIRLFNNSVQRQCLFISGLCRLVNTCYFHDADIEWGEDARTKARLACAELLADVDAHGGVERKIA